LTPQVGNGDPYRLAPTPSSAGVLIDALDPAADSANATARVTQASVSSGPQAGNGDLTPLAPTLPQTSVPLDAKDAAQGPASATAKIVQLSVLPPQGANGDSSAVLPTLLPISMLDQANKPTDTITGIDLAALVSEAPSGNGLGQKSPAVPASSFSTSSPAPPAEISKSVSFHPALGMKATETISAASAPAKEILTAKVPANQEHAATKTADSSSNLTEAIVQPTSPSAIPAAPTGPVAGSAPSGPLATANLLPLVSPAADQVSGSRNAAPAAATEPQASAVNSPTPLPTVGTVETARLVAGASQSEMHLGLQTQAFGNVEVHTVVRDSQVGLTVGSERGDLRSLLAPEVSGLQTTFRQQDLRFDNIRFLDSSAATTAGFSGGADSQPRSPSQQHSSPGGLFSIHGPPEDPAELDIGDRLRTGLNVLA
jgi:hypothetical protein